MFFWYLLVYSVICFCQSSQTVPFSQPILTAIFVIKTVKSNRYRLLYVDFCFNIPIEVISQKQL